MYHVGKDRRHFLVLPFLRGLFLCFRFGGLTDLIDIELLLPAHRPILSHPIPPPVTLIPSLLFHVFVFVCAVIALLNQRAVFTDQVRCDAKAAKRTPLPPLRVAVHCFVGERPLGGCFGLLLLLSSPLTHR